MSEYYHHFRYKNPNKVIFEIGVEIILARDESLSYRAYDIKEEPYEFVHLKRCPLTKDKKPSTKGIEKQIKEVLRGWFPFDRNEDFTKRLSRLS